MLDVPNKEAMITISSRGEKAPSLTGPFLYPPGTESILDVLSVLISLFSSILSVGKLWKFVGLSYKDY
jgi:hypothetical protein